ncbi:intestinal mucin-like protein [Dendrobates tinctorius]|uniref:intestinal mucin-like protein n=1 Tax=Dendrobates tinctorius TaxID=92724 RepID=UPI003CC9A06D
MQSKSIPTKHSVSTKHVTTPSKVTTSLYQTTKNTVTSLPRESTTSLGTLTTVEEVQTYTPKIPKTTGAITTTLEKTTENPTSLPTQRPVTTKPIKVFTTSQKLVSTQTIKPPTKSREVTTTFETTGKVTSAKASTASHKATTELEQQESATSEPPGKVTKVPTESHRETSQSSTTTSKSFPPTQCMCNVNGKLVPPDQDIYNTFDNAGWCFYAKCNQDCKVEKYSEPCHTSTVPTSTSSTKPTQTVTSSTSTQTIKMTITTNIPEETTSTSVSTTVSTTNPGCNDLIPPRMLNETWIMDKCTEARCIGQNEIAIIKKPCPSLNEKACANLLVPKKISDNSGCCYDLECECVCGGWRTSHYITFDGTYYSFSGNCTYVLVQQITPVFNHFRVYIDNFSCNPDDPTCVTTLLIMYETETIVLKSQSFNKTVANQIYVNGERVYPAISRNGITITCSGIFVIVEIPEIGAYISFNLLSFKVKLPLSKFFNNTEGHCGKCSNNRADDCILPNEQLAPSCPQMAEQWRVPNKNSSSCSSIPTSVPTRVPSVSPILLSNVPHATSAKVPSKKPQKPDIITGADQPCPTPEVCTLILSSVFEGCHSIVPPENFYEACVSDGCTTVEGDILCSSLQSYARICGMKGVCTDWRERTNGLCPKKCPSHLEYNPCGPAVEPTCNSRYNDAFVNKTSEDYVEGCYCPRGTTKFNTVLHICVPICGCTGPDGLPREPGEIWDINCQTCICDQASLTVLCAEKDCALPAPKNCSEEGYMPVLVPDSSNPCCQVIECRCNISLCSNTKMVCKPGYEVILYMNPDACCPVYKCETKKVCVDREIEYQPGATVPSSRPCEKCICDEKMIANTGQHLVSCVSTRCLKKCAQGFIYTDVPGECCGTCKQTDCIVDLPDNTTYLLKPGDTGSPPGDNCTIYECAHNNDRFVTVESKISCPKTNLDGCAPADIQKDDKGCCFICVKPQKTCQLVKEKNYIWDKDCHSIKPVETSYCKGSCESYSIFSAKTLMMEQYCACCEETKAKKITIGLLCPNGKMKKYSFINAVSCDCVQTLCKKEASRDIEEEDLFEDDNKSNTTVSPVKPAP